MINGPFEALSFAIVNRLFAFARVWFCHAAMRWWTVLAWGHCEEV